MCHVCGSQLPKVGKGFHCRTCAQNIYGKCERKGNSNSSRLDAGEPSGCYIFSMEKYEQEPSKLDGLNPCGTPMISPAISLTSFGSCASNCGDFSTDLNLQSWEEPEDESTMDTCKQDHNPCLSNVEAQAHGSLMEKVDALGVHPSDVIPNSILVKMVNHENSNCDNKGIFTDTSKDDGVMINEGHSEGEKHVISSFLQHGADLSQPFDIETKAQIWIPPEAEDKEDDLESSVAHNDDDDEYGDGIKWVPSSSLSCFSEENHRNHSFKEERQKVIVEVVTGQFRSTVGQLLNSMGIGEIWKDIVASLSWEAARLIKPDANEGINLDPVHYLKVKCIASESRDQSQVVKGLVFKKSAAHKHMITMYKNPRLLLLKGILEQRASGLSSFDSMAEEDDYLKSITEMIELCNPNVVLVEKTVSRDLQEALLKKGITLVFDMKLARLEKIARCTGSQIFSSLSNLMNPKLKQCDFFHVDKCLEEHNSSGEGGKRSSKTLMFFEGCPKPLGCTILLKGAHSEELKKVKSVVQEAVFVAFHSILETSFLVDQRAVVSNDHTGVANAALTSAHNLGVMLEVPKTAITSSDNLDISISDAFVENSVPEGLSQNVNLNTEEIHPPETHQFEMSHVSLGPSILSGYLFSSLSASLRRVLGDSFPLFPSSYQSISLYFGLNEDDIDSATTGEGLASPSPQKDAGEKEVQMGINHKNPHDNGAVMEPITCPEVPPGNCEICVDHQDLVPQKDGMKTVLGPRSILILRSSQCLTKGAVSKQSRLSRIKYYGHFDMSLGRFLHDFILNQKYFCATCGDPPDAHTHCYIHLNGKLTVHVKQLPPEQWLPGEAEGKIWMWTRCLKCEWKDGAPMLTGRVVMSTTSHGLSFGKLLELSFSNHCASSRLSSCGHSLHRDCLHFYGLGSIVAMFKYSPVDLYVACNPLSILEFNNPNGQEWLYGEAQEVLAKGHLLFAEVMNSLQKIQSRFSGLSLKQPMNLGGSVKGFTEIEDMLNQEKSDFEASLEKAVCRNGHLGQIVHQILNLNRLNHELLLELYVWDRRLHYLLSSLGSVDGQHNAQLKLQKEDIFTRKTEENNIMEYAGKSSDDPSDHNSGNSGKLVSPASIVVSDMTTDPACGQGEETCLQTEITGENVHSSDPLVNMLIDHVEGNGVSTRPSDQGNQDNVQASQMQVEVAVLDGAKLLRQSEPVAALNNRSGVIITDSTLSEVSCYPVAQSSVASELQDPEGWVWTSFSETRKVYRKELQRGYSQKFEFINSYSPEHLSSVDELITQERSRLHFPVGTGDDVVSVYEDEFTSIIACALALSLDKANSFKTSAEIETREVKGGMNMKIETQSSLASDVGVASPYWTSSGSFNFDGIHLVQSVSSQELSEFDSFSPADPLHPEISLGGGKLPGKGKYSVICVHAKQFFALRRRCCPSELDYISSLSRCKKWDAQGGKSKVFFAKTLDDRFIVKQVKKTELDSFLKFAPEYFKHISESLSTGSQSCLAKILGIYQVIIQQDKNGKELKMDLMVMENLLFGRNVSRLYDLKGALHSRYVTDANGPGKVLLDQNFVEDMLISPIHISGKTKHILERAIWNDTCFLTSINVMDYSLLVGVNQQKREIVFGIIDYLRQYTWDKHLETWVKSSLVVPKNALPTVISPKEYKKRFRKFMSTYFLILPDLYPDGLSESSELCENGKDSSSLNDAEKMESST